MSEMLFDRDKLNELIKAVDEATGDSITFDGKLLLVAYAKYLIEYIDMRLKGNQYG